MAITNAHRKLHAERAAKIRADREQFIDSALADIEAEEAEYIEGIEEEEAPAPRSIVKGVYKTRYAERAAEKGLKSKAAKRSCCDWLALQLAKLVNNDDKRQSLNVPALERLLEANGIRHEAWKREGNGWQGRLRMSGRLALQAEVADAGELVLPDGKTIRAPKSWCERVQR